MLWRFAFRLLCWNFFEAPFSSLESVCPGLLKINVQSKTKQDPVKVRTEGSNNICLSEKFSGDFFTIIQLE